MAFTLATLSAAVAVNDVTVMLSALTGLLPNNYFTIDKEVFKCLSVPTAATVPVPVLRGQEGTAQVAHPLSAQVKIGQNTTDRVAGDWTDAPPGSPSNAMLAAAPSRDLKSYSAAGAITLPAIGHDMVAVINGTGALAMTIANPTIAHDGSKLIVCGNGKAAHTVTYAAGLGNVGGTADVVTFSASIAQGIELLAVGGFWVTLGLNTAVAGAGATINGVGLA